MSSVKFIDGFQLRFLMEELTKSFLGSLGRIKFLFSLILLTIQTIERQFRETESLRVVPVANI